MELPGRFRGQFPKHCLVVLGEAPEMPEAPLRRGIRHRSVDLDRPPRAIEPDRTQIRCWSDVKRVLEAVLQGAATDPQMTTDRLYGDEILRHLVCESTGASHNLPAANLGNAVAIFGMIVAQGIDHGIHKIVSHGIHQPGVFL